MVEFLVDGVNEIGGGLVVGGFDMSVEGVGVFRMKGEYVIEKWGEVFEGDIGVVDGGDEVYGVDKLEEVDGIGGGLKKGGGGLCWVVGGY